MSWFIRELPLRETVTTGDLNDTYATPRDTRALVELVNKIGRLDHREGVREILRRVAARAGVELGPAACWLLARLSEQQPDDLETLAARADVPVGRLTSAQAELEAAGLITPSPEGSSGYAPDPRRSRHARATDRNRRTATRRPARGLAPRGARGPHHMIAKLAQEFFIDTSALGVREALV